MMLRFLAGVNLLLLAGLLGLRLFAETTDRVDAAAQWRLAKTNEFEWTRCETKHRTLLRYIRKEGLWRRLGLDGQPWLQ